MAEELVKILKVEAGNSGETIKGLRENISALKKGLSEATIGSEEFKEIQEALTDQQDKLREAMHVGTMTLDDAKKVVGQANVSYNTLVNTMAELKKQWRATTDEAERDALGKTINDINNQLKELDASTGNFQRNVGNYAGSLSQFFTMGIDKLSQNNMAIGSIGKILKDLIPAIKLVETTTETASNGIRTSLMSTGIGAIIPIVATLVGHMEDLKKIFGEHETASQKLKAATDELTKSFHAQNAEIENEITLMEASGANTSEILAKRIELNGQQLDMIQTQILEAQATLQQIVNHSRLRRVITGEQDDMKALADEINNLKEKENELREERAKLFTQYQADWIKLRNTQKETAAETAEVNEELIADMDFMSDELEAFHNERMAAQQATDYELIDQNQLAVERAAMNEAYEEFWTLYNEDTQRHKDSMAKKAADAQRYASATASILNSLSAIMEANGEASEKDAKGAKNLKAAATTIDTISGAIAAYTGTVAAVPGPAGLVLGALNAATVTAAGMASVAQIRSTNVSRTASAGTTPAAPAVVSSPAVIMEAPVMRTLTSASQEEQLNRMASDTRVYVVESDINEAGKRVEVRDNESTF